MKAKWRGKIVKVTKLITHKSIYITHPIITQVRIEWKDENGVKWSDYADTNDIEFL